MKKNSKLLLILFIIIAFLILFMSQNKSYEYKTHITGSLGTDCDITIITQDDGKKHIDEISNKIDYYDSIFSEDNIEITPETYHPIIKSREFYEKTEGVFDITVGAVSKLWSKTFKTNEIPSDLEIKESLKTVGFDKLIFNDEKNTVEKTDVNQKIILGAVAKGYIADKISEYLNSEKIDDALVNLGGNIFVKGKNKNGEIWNIGVANPDEPTNALLSLSLTDKFVITSGNYIRYVDINGTRYHHIINAKTGYPVQNELKSVTIISNDGFTGDALSTSCYLLGLKDGIELVKQYDVLAIFVTNNNEIYYSGELEEEITRISVLHNYIKF